MVRSWLRSFVAAPKLSHYDIQLQTELDLSYITPRIIVCSGPVSDWLHTWYRYHVTELVAFLDAHHPEQWHMWNFRGEGPGYSDLQVRGRVSHYPFPDHQVPPLTMLIDCTSEIDRWLKKSNDTVAVLHCKAGKGRSGTMCCAYLLLGDPKVSGLMLKSDSADASGHNTNDEGDEDYSIRDNITVDSVVAEYTIKRMRKHSGSGISIKSQFRYLQYWYRFLRSSDNPIVPQRRKVRISSIKFREMASLAKIQLQTYSESQGVYTIQTLLTYSVKGDGQDMELDIDQVVDTSDVKICVDEYAYCWFNVNFEELGVVFAWNQFDGLKGTGFKGVARFREMSINWYEESLGE